MASVAYIVLSAFGWVAFTLYLVMLVFKKVAAARAKISDETKEIEAKCSNSEKTVGFFHPYCNAGGGGERVLWCAVNAIIGKYDNAHCVIYTGDIDANAEDIVARAKDRYE
eukprot:gene29958-13168_t